MNRIRRLTSEEQQTLFPEAEVPEAPKECSVSGSNHFWVSVKPYGHNLYWHERYAGTWCSYCSATKPD